MLAKQEWILMGRKDVLTSDAVKNNLKYRLDEEENSIYEIRRENARRVKAFVGTWSVHIDRNSVVKIGASHCAHKHEDLENKEGAGKLTIKKDEVLLQTRVYCREQDKFEDASFIFKIYDRK